MNQATRAIYWNVEHPANRIIMYILFGLALVVALNGIIERIRLWRSGKSEPYSIPPLHTLIENLLTWTVFQKGVVRERAGLIIHGLIYLGFLTLLFTTTMVFIHEDLGIEIYQGRFYLAVTVFSDILGLGLLVGCLLALKRRYLDKPDLLHTRFADVFALGLLILLVVQGFALEGLRIKVTEDPWATYSIVGLLVSKIFWGMSEDAARMLHFSVWWFHTITVFAGFALMPYTKLFHIFSSSMNLAFKDRKRPKGQLSFPGDIEKLMETEEDLSFGYETIKDYSWKKLLDLDACTSCGRCQDVCPAYRSGKPLSPKWLMLDTRNHMLGLNATGQLGEPALHAGLKKLDATLMKSFFLSSSGLSSVPENGEAKGLVLDDEGRFRANNEKVQAASLSLGASADERIAGGVIDPDVFWSCTTCMACVEACPVGINHVDQIVENRRNMVLMQGEVPNEAQGTLRALENRANPYGAPEDRGNWLQGLDVKVLKPGSEVEYLYWVGCVSAYDPRKQKIAQSLVKIMKACSLNFGVLGSAENCTGDPARRLGEENLYQTLAKKNIELLKSLKFKYLVANCPHCFNTIKNEYPQLGNLQDGSQPEIIHHSQLIWKLLDSGNLKLTKSQQEAITFHDPCYLGRYNSEYDAPRKSLSKASSLNILEMTDTKEKGLCCGAGGGHFWMDLKIGERVNSIRAKQAEETGAKTVATACPFCMQMMEDGIKINSAEEKLEVKDIAEVVAEALA